MVTAHCLLVMLPGLQNPLRGEEVHRHPFRKARSCHSGYLL